MKQSNGSIVKKVLLGFILSCAVGLAACQPTEEEPVEPVEETGTETSEDSETGDPEVEDTLAEDDDQELMYKEMLAQAQVFVDSKEYDEAAGTLTVLLESDLSEYPEIKLQAETLNAEIADNQTGIDGISGGTDLEASLFKEERQSELVSQLYQDETGQAIEDATDEQLQIWLEADEESQIEESSMTKEEAEDYAFEQLLERVNLENEAYFFFVNQEDAEWVQLEARESVDQDGVAWSNLIGMYRYNIQTDDLLQLDSATGEYSSVE